MHWCVYISILCSILASVLSIPICHVRSVRLVDRTDLSFDCHSLQFVLCFRSLIRPCSHEGDDGCEAFHGEHRGCLLKGGLMRLLRLTVCVLLTIAVAVALHFVGLYLED